LTGVLAAGAAAIFGADGRAAAAIGGMIALSSTAVVLNLLVSRAELDSVHGRTALGILLVQDMAVVPLVLMVETLAGGGNADATSGTVLRTIAGAVGLIVAFLVLFNFVMPRVSTS
jgi:CPA2 family monovalent cation:H+ antiporter-2